MILLGINDNHDASCCLIRDGEIIDVIQEERITRKKGISSLPINSIKYILKKNKITGNEIHHVCVANLKLHHMNLWNIACEFKISDWNKIEEKFYYPKIFKKKKIRLKEIFKYYKPSNKLGYSLKKIPFLSGDEATSKSYEHINRIRIDTISNLIGISKNNITFHDHHTCHALYAFFTNPFQKKNTVMVTSDGGGDGIYNSVSIFQNNKLNFLSRSKKNWIGRIYWSITLILGMNPFRHAYKVMGLAPYANEKNFKNITNFFLNTLKVNNIDFKINNKVKDNFFYFKENLKHYRFDNIAGGLQQFVELTLSKWFENISKKTKSKNFTFSGGVANNVKANKYLSEKKYINKIWIPPGPGDESLCIGATYDYIYKKIGLNKSLKYIKKPDNAYWGMDINQYEIKKFINNKDIKKKFLFKRDKNFKKSAILLKNNEIIFICSNRQEFGPRALGHRSIVCNPSNIDSVKKINDTIKMRDFWMPFTPSILDTFKKKYLKKNEKLNLDFMTSCVETTDLGKVHLKAAIHQSDETVRPQLVTKKDNSSYYQLINAFKKETGIGALLNTSLNMHEFPVVNNPTDIIKEILSKNKKINFNILINDYLFIRKNY